MINSMLPRLIAWALIFGALSAPGLAQSVMEAPGAVNPAVNQENIKTTICKKGWTKTVRPPSTYTTKLKIMQLRAAGITGHASDYVEDHVVPLEAGGDPTNPQNLQPQLRADAETKDRTLENPVNRKICAGTLTLKEGQAVFLKSHQ